MTRGEWREVGFRIAREGLEEGFLIGADSEPTEPRSARWARVFSLTTPAAGTFVAIAAAADRLAVSGI